MSSGTGVAYARQLSCQRDAMDNGHVVVDVDPLGVPTVRFEIDDQGHAGGIRFLKRSGCKAAGDQLASRRAAGRDGLRARAAGPEKESKPSKLVQDTEIP